MYLLSYVKDSQC